MILIRPCQGLDELQACEDLEIEVWGYCQGDVIPRRAFLVAQKIGGQVLGAFDTDLPSSGTGEAAGSAANMIGFAFSWPGIRQYEGRQEVYLHSHMLAVREGYRNQSVGARLKLAQRDEALSRGIRRMEWTFDPLEIKNASLNIRKLGAVIRRYEENFYGVSSSRLQGGLPTDRLVAEWWLDSPRVRAAIAGRAPEVDTAGETKIVVPSAIAAWKASDADRQQAEAVQTENRKRFQEAFAAGCAVVAFSRNADGDGVYHLARWSVDVLESHTAGQDEIGIGNQTQ